MTTAPKAERLARQRAELLERYGLPSTVEQIEAGERGQGVKVQLVLQFPEGST